MLKIQVIVGSTRDNRHGLQVAEWIFNLAKSYSDWGVEIVDLKEWDLPMYNEPKPEIAQKWMAKIAEADGYIIVTPEYNHGYPASLKNALDYPYEEWEKKAVGFVGYSRGRGAGIRSVEQLRQVAVELNMANVPTAIYVANAWEAFEENGNPKDLKLNDLVKEFFDDLEWWVKALKDARGKA